jgi:hypothetical protein
LASLPPTALELVLMLDHNLSWHCQSVVLILARFLELEFLRFDARFGVFPSFLPYVGLCLLPFSGFFSSGFVIAVLCVILSHRKTVHFDVSKTSLPEFVFRAPKKSSFV